MNDKIKLYPVLDFTDFVIARDSKAKDDKLKIIGSEYFKVKDGKATYLNLTEYKEMHRVCGVESSIVVSGDITLREEDYSTETSHYLGFEELEEYREDFELVEAAEQA